MLDSQDTLPAVSGVNLTALNADNIASGTLAAARLADSGVSAGSVGSATAIPVLTVDAKGRITATSTAAITTTLVLLVVIVVLMKALIFHLKF